MNIPKPKHTPPMPECAESKIKQFVSIIGSDEDMLKFKNSIGHKVIFQGRISNNYIKSATICLNDAVIENVEQLDNGEVKIDFSITGIEIKGDIK